MTRPEAVEVDMAAQVEQARITIDTLHADIQSISSRHALTVFGDSVSEVIAAVGPSRVEEVGPIECQNAGRILASLSVRRYFGNEQTEPTARVIDFSRYGQGMNISSYLIWVPNGLYGEHLIDAGETEEDVLKLVTEAHALVVPTPAEVAAAEATEIANYEADLLSRQRVTAAIRRHQDELYKLIDPTTGYLKHDAETGKLLGMDDIPMTDEEAFEADGIIRAGITRRHSGAWKPLTALVKLADHMNHNRLCPITPAVFEQAAQKL